MDRREFLQSLSACAALSALPRSVLAQQVGIGALSSFVDALKTKPWLLGFAGTSEAELRSPMTVAHGKVPNQLAGRLFRNGPAYHSLGNDRFEHWFDAPGMAQRFDISSQGIQHHGRYLATNRNTQELEQQRILFAGFGTSDPSLSNGGSADGQNPANINFVEHADELLALWEGGSAHRIDPDTLITQGIKTWSPETAGLPFGAHPKKDQDGNMWNIGYSIAPSALILYQVSPEGTLEQSHVVPMPNMRMVHDFVITDSKVMVMLPPLESTPTGQGAFYDQFRWEPQKSTEIWIFDKSDLNQFSVLEMDAFWVFHFGNAYDLSSTEIAFDFSMHDSPHYMDHVSYGVMDGSWDGGPASPSIYASGIVDLTKQSVKLERVSRLNNVEFLQTDPRHRLTQHRFVTMVGESGGAGRYGFDRLMVLDRQSDAVHFYDADQREMLEEHVMVPKPGGGDDFWIVGTSLHWGEQRTYLSIYEGQAVGDGPVCRAFLDYALPLGLHGLFLSA